MTSHPYPNYRDSGIEWLGDVPSHWQTKRLKRIGEAIIGLTYSPDDVVDEGFGTLVLRSSNVQEGRILLHDNVYVSVPIPEKLRTKSGDILICSRNGSRALIGKNALIEERSAGMSFGAFMTVFRSDLNGYLRYVFNSYLFESQSSSFLSSTINQLTSGNLLGMTVPLPPLSEQAAIARFLDRETAKIDALVEEQKLLIDLLKEKRQAVISHAVTKGLNPDLPKKDSGIEWLGEVPEHWNVKPLKYVVEFQSGGTPSKANPAYWEGSVPWASAKDLKSDRLATTLDHITEAALQDGAASLVPPESIIVLVRGMMLARAFPVCVAAVPMAINQDLKAVNGFGVNNDFLAWVLRGLERETLSRLDEAGHGTKALRMDAWTSMSVPIPPVDEQQAIAAHLEQETEKNERLQAAAERAITLLQERRSALISAAVTGKIDVRHQQTPAVDANLVRAAVGFEVVRRLAHRPTFGRVKLQKIVYLAETYAGLEELGGSYQREAAGPLDRKLIADIETLLQRDGEVLVAQPDGRGSAVAYRFSGPRPKVEREDLGRLLGDRRERFEQVLTKVGDLDTKGAEAVATLYAVWNDALLDQSMVSDERIITGFLTEWHPEKPLKFKRDELHTWLGWMRRNGIIPMGQGPRTQTGRLVI